MYSGIFLMWGKKQNSRDNTKWAEKPHFHFGSQAEKAIKSN